jgi:putative transposase
MFASRSDDLLYRTLRFELRPTVAQRARLLQMAGARRFVYNWGLHRWREYYAASGGSIDLTCLMAELTKFKRSSEGSWLYEVPSSIPQQALLDLRAAYKRFFRKQARYPAFRSRKKDRPRFRIAQHVRVRGDRVYVPKLGWVRVRLSRPVTGETKSATFKQDGRGRWFVSLMQPFSPAAPLPSTGSSIGVDVGLTEFAVLSDGTRIPAGRFRRREQRRVRRLQRGLMRKPPGSHRRRRAQLRLAKAHQQVVNRRRDFLHQLTTELIREHDIIAIEDLCVRGLARTKLASSVHDASWSEFRRQLEYKARWNGRRLIVVDRSFPSTRMCSACGVVQGPRDLSVRSWTCGCGAHHDRELNAALNLQAEAERQLAVGHTDSRNRPWSQRKTPDGSSRQ